MTVVPTMRPTSMAHAEQFFLKENNIKYLNNSLPKQPVRKDSPQHQFDSKPPNVFSTNSKDHLLKLQITTNFSVAQ